MASMAVDFHHHQQHPLQRKRPSWVTTLVVQTALCLALYTAFNLGMPRAAMRSNGNDGGAGDLYFLSVLGGPMDEHEQTQLLQQLDAAARIHKAKFVVAVSEFGEDDPLLRNATLYFPSLRIPWFATSVLKGQESRYFLKQVALPHEQTLDIIGLDTGSWQDFIDMEQESDISSKQLRWLRRTLAVANSTWRIVAGFQPLLNCNQQQPMTGKMKLCNHLLHVFPKYRINAYLSKQGYGHHYIQHSGISYLANPGQAGAEYKPLSTDGSSNASREMQNNFLLHRIGPLEMESYFFNSTGAMTSTYTHYQWGKEAM